MVNEPLGDVLRRRRIHRGLKSFEMAQQVGVSRGYWCDIERGRRKNPGRKLLEKAANVLGCPMSDLEPYASLERPMPAHSVLEGFVKLATADGLQAALSKMSIAELLSSIRKHAEEALAGDRPYMIVAHAEILHQLSVALWNSVKPLRTKLSEEVKSGVSAVMPPP